LKFAFCQNVNVYRTALSIIGFIQPKVHKNAGKVVGATSCEGFLICFENGRNQFLL